MIIFLTDRLCVYKQTVSLLKGTEPDGDISNQSYFWLNIAMSYVLGEPNKASLETVTKEISNWYHFNQTSEDLPTVEDLNNMIIQAHFSTNRDIPYRDKSIKFLTALLEEIDE